MQKLVSVLFLAVLAGWGWLEFFQRRPETEGLRDILFWIGMACLFLTLSRAPRRPARAEETGSRERS